MKKTYNHIWLLKFAILIYLLCLITACSRPTPQSLPAEEILNRAVRQMKALQSFHFLIDRSGALKYLNANQTVAFAQAEGDFYAPDQAQATIRVILPGFVAEVHMVALGDEYWESGLVSNQWEKLPPGTGFNPATMFDPQSGFQEILLKDLHDLSYAGLQELEELPGQSFYVLGGKLEGERVYELSYGMMGPQAMEVSLWIAPDTFEVYRVQIDELQPPGEGEEDDTRWQVDFWEFNQVEPIKRPEP